MADLITIARPYAQAIFNQAVADNRLEEWSLVLGALKCVTESEALQTILGDPKISDETLESTIYETLKEVVSSAVSGLADKLNNALSLLFEEKRLTLAPEINELFHRLLADYNKTIEVDVYSASEMDEEQRKAMYASLEKRFASKVSIQFHEDKSLIGGALVRSGNWVLDGSIRGKVARLEELLMN